MKKIRIDLIVTTENDEDTETEVVDLVFKLLNDAINSVDSGITDFHFVNSHEVHNNE